MAFEQSFREPTLHFESDEDVSIKQNWKSFPAPTTASDNSSGCFECNICLDSADDPVVTLCGHLYCWPCIYKWLQVQSSSSDSSVDQPKCPVCKSNVSQSSLVPLYGRGTSSLEMDPKKTQPDLIIPRRPAALGAHTLVTSMASRRSPYHSRPPQFHPQQLFSQYPYGSFDSTSDFGNSAMTSVFRPTVGMFGEMVFARMFGNTDTSLFAYHQNSYPIIGIGSRRTRRHEMEANESLSRVAIFLFCCFVLCLLLF